MHKRSLYYGKSFFSLVFFFVFLFSISSVLASADVAYLYRSSAKIDRIIISTFNEMGLSVELVKEKSSLTDFSKYKLIFVGDENFRYPSRIPVLDSPSVIANYYDAETWGITNRDGVSKLGSTNVLSVIKGGQVIQVYTQAFKKGTVTVPYHYLDNRNKAQAMQTIAKIGATSSISDAGDVVSYASSGSILLNEKVTKGGICFYGIIESDYWTPEAKQLFKDCVNLIIIQCHSDSDCPDSYVSEPFCKSKNIFKTTTSHKCINPGKINSECTEDIRDKLFKECSIGCENGECSFECYKDLDCGSVSYSNNYCQGKSVYKDKTLPLCSNGECSSGKSKELVKECSSLCLAGECFEIACYDDLGCSDKNPKTIDECLNPGTVASKCRNTEINCNFNSDCGFIGHIGSEFCKGNDVYKNFQTALCNNAGTLSSSCSLEVTEKLINQCDYACINGVCIRCGENNNCDDRNSLTEDICIYPRTKESYCSNKKKEPVCGNEILEEGEECDDGNLVNSDGCSSACKKEKITCYDNEDCGIDSFVGSEYCQGKDVVQDFNNYTCVNPGKYNSFCASSVQKKIKEQCSIACYTGDCINNICEHPSSIVMQLLTPMLVVGENCYKTNKTVDNVSTSIPSSGTYGVYGNSLRGNPGQNQTKEEFFLEINGLKGPVSKDDVVSSAITSRFEFLGNFLLNSGKNTIFMKTAAKCPPDNTANSVQLDKLCLIKI